MNDLISRQAAIDGKICIQRANGVEIYDDYAVPVEYLEQLPPAQPEQRWIPCSERMPEESGWYIVTVEDETDTYLRWFSTLHGFEWEEKDNTIAWMPMPKPYREERTEE